MDHMRRRREVQPRTARFDREHEERDTLVLLELANQIFALLDLCLAMQDEAGPPEDRAEECRQRRRCLPELSEDEGFLLPSGNDFRDVAQTRELAAVLLRPSPIAEPLRWMIADLLQPHEGGQDNTPSPDPIRRFDLISEIGHGLLVERCLLAA